MIIMIISRLIGHSVTVINNIRTET